MRVQRSWMLAVVFALACSRTDRRPSAEAEQPRATCLGPPDATTFAVYLHGMDAPEVSHQEVENRAALTRVAARLSMRIAVPRATLRCPESPDLVCWGWAFTDGELDTAADEIRAAADTCFGAEPHGVIGFSNGGYLVSKLYRTCTLRDRLPRATWAVTFGSALLHGSIEPHPESLAGCGRLVVAVGTEDHSNSDPDDRLVQALKAKGGDVSAVRYPGGHALPEESLQEVLEALLDP